MKFYKFNVKYWLDYTDNDEELEANGIVVAESYKRAVEKLEARLQHLVSFTLTEWTEDTDFLFMDYHTLDQLFADIEGEYDE